MHLQIYFLSYLILVLSFSSHFPHSVFSPYFLLLCFPWQSPYLWITSHIWSLPSLFSALNLNPVQDSPAARLPLSLSLCSPPTATAPLPGPQDFLHPVQDFCLPALLLPAPSVPSLFQMLPGAFSSFQFSPLSASSKASPCFILLSILLMELINLPPRPPCISHYPLVQHCLWPHFPFSQVWANTKRQKR